MSARTATEDAGPTRRTQAERSDATRTALLEAAISSLIEDGYAMTTTARVAERAGVSRGAHLHHFGTRNGLIAAAVERLGTHIVGDLEQRLEGLPGDPSRTSRALDLLWEAFSSDLFAAAVELWAVARTDPELASALVPLERTLNRQVRHVYASLFPDQRGASESEELASFVLATIRGLALLDIVEPSATGTADRWPFARTTLLRVIAPPRA